MLLNFITLVLAIFIAIWQNYQGNIGYCLMYAAIAVMDLPFAIKWIAEYFGLLAMDGNNKICQGDDEK